MTICFSTSYAQYSFDILIGKNFMEENRATQPTLHFEAAYMSAWGVEGGLYYAHGTSNVFIATPTGSIKQNVDENRFAVTLSSSAWPTDWYLNFQPQIAFGFIQQVHNGYRLSLGVLGERYIPAQKRNFVWVQLSMEIKKTLLGPLSLIISPQLNWADREREAFFTAIAGGLHFAF